VIDTTRTPTAAPAPTPSLDPASELLALRSEVRILRDEVHTLSAILRQASTRITHLVEMQTPDGAEALAKALAERDAYRLEVQHQLSKRHPVRPEHFAEEIRAHGETSPLSLEVFAALENSK